MPLEPELEDPDELDEPDEPELELVVPAEPEPDECDEEELLPQPAAMIASSVSASAAGRREILNVVMP
jgi:hypothetical protein